MDTYHLVSPINVVITVSKHQNEFRQQTVVPIQDISNVILLALTQIIVILFIYLTGLIPVRVIVLDNVFEAAPSQYPIST